MGRLGLGSPFGVRRIDSTSRGGGEDRLQLGFRGRMRHCRRTHTHGAQRVGQRCWFSRAFVGVVKRECAKCECVNVGEERSAGAGQRGYRCWSDCRSCARRVPPPTTFPTPAAPLSRRTTSLSASATPRASCRCACATLQTPFLGKPSAENPHHHDASAYDENLLTVIRSKGASCSAPSTGHMNDPRLATHPRGTLTLT